MVDYTLDMDRDDFDSNDFVVDLNSQYEVFGGKNDLLEQIKKEWHDHLECIDFLLYRKLNAQDKNTFIRFFLKRFYNLNTATQEEIEAINNVFEKVKAIYKKSDNDYIEFTFRDRIIRYMKNRHLKQDESLAENMLMNYYDVAHAFFLTEYEMEKYNPLNGQTILDCGAAYGDTLLLFRTLYPDSQIHSFEAAVSNVEIIEENIRMNNVENVVINTTFLYKDSEWHLMNKDNGRIVDKNSENVVKVQTKSIDDYVKENNLKNIGLIKFDIEGAEQNALSGSIETIMEQKPLLYIPIYHLKSDLYEIPRFLESLNMPMSYRLKWTDKKVWGMDCVLFVRFE